MTQLWLARHGQTDDNLAGDVFQGFRDTPLNATGRDQAAVLARRIQDELGPGLAGLWCSDLRRARETAEILGAAVGLEPRLEPRLREGNRGDWEGRRFGEVAAADPQGYAAWLSAGPDFAFPGGESLCAHQARVLAALTEITAAGRADAPSLVVCHRGSIRVALCARDPRGLHAFHDHDVANTGLVPW
ncbi:MAG TPA: histidine phosphatase family protein [Solirubrobacteraceae bacterium]|nr:histidine phosphatase family protein [Solirubrobacteraceae bacterium]